MCSSSYTDEHTSSLAYHSLHVHIIENTLMIIKLCKGRDCAVCNRQNQVESHYAAATSTPLGPEDTEIMTEEIRTLILHRGV